MHFLKCLNLQVERYSVAQKNYGARNKNKIIMSSEKMIVMVPSGLKNLRIYEGIYLFISRTPGGREK